MSKFLQDDDYLDRIQADTAGILAGVPKLALATHLVDDEGDIEAGVLRKLATLDDKTGKRGLAIIVLMPEVVEADENLPGPQMEVSQEVQVIEQVLLNRDATSGTRIRSATAALRVLSALHMHTVGNFTWYAGRNAIKPLPMDRKGFVSHSVEVRLRLSVPVPAKPQAVSMTNEAGVMTLSCATPGASIYYSLDGSLPGPANGTAVLYSVPIVLEPIPVGTLLRTAAYAPEMNPGDVLEVLIRE